MIENWMSTKEVSILLGISPTAVQRLRARGTLAGVWACRGWMFRRDIVRELQESLGYKSRTRRVNRAA